MAGRPGTEMDRAFSISNYNNKIRPEHTKKIFFSCNNSAGIQGKAGIQPSVRHLAFLTGEKIRYSLISCQDFSVPAWKMGLDFSHGI